jgi:hypothetical protein
LIDFIGLKRWLLIVLPVVGTPEIARLFVGIWLSGAVRW